MPGRPEITADEQERSALQALARSARRNEADRARAILATLAGQRAAGIAAGLGGHASTVREWRGRFRRGGTVAPRHHKPHGRPDQVGAAAAALAMALLAATPISPTHTGKPTTKVLAERPWLTPEWLPKHAPELNAIEHRWRDLERHYLANRTFAGVGELDRVIIRPSTGSIRSDNLIRRLPSSRLLRAWAGGCNTGEGARLLDRAERHAADEIAL